METVAALLLVGSILAFLFGVVNIIYPLKQLKITKRLVGVFIVIGSMAGCMGAGSLGIAAQPGGWTAEMARQEAERKEAEKNKPAEPVVAAKTAPPAGVTQAEFDVYQQSIMTALAPCDQAVARAGAVLQEGDVYSAYPVVKSAENVCLGTSTDVTGVKIPRSAKGEVKKAFQDARDSCRMVGTMKWSAMRDLAKVLDGDNRPSAVSAAREGMESASGFTLRCVVGLAATAEAANLKFMAEDAQKE
ncbi:hypothetical protein [Brevundimonas nasdae]|uniref:hypothetical protein n=1 Tax=Brevundimonas nasdae TaxID=172043 RepID=UPI003F6912EC